MRDAASQKCARGAHTQEQFAEVLGVSLKYLQRIEAGRANLTIRSLVRLANALGVRPMELLRRPRARTVRRGRPPKRAKS